jgi:GalNAc-alpha-(1->4)-GalNAc-alpha-(1->3)-diNAcBac-PP-undecaprenol alpha-1,4-N-acetyl-D-galactosaminyltransferase
MERSLTNIANYAANVGHNVTILNLFKTEVFFELNPNIKVIWPSLQREKMHRLLYAVRLLPFIRRELNLLRPDSVLSFGEWFNGYVLIATRGLGLPVYISDRMGPDLYLGWLIEFMRSQTYRFASGIIAQTAYAKAKIFKKTGAKDIVTVGRLSREKGHIVLIRAFAQLSQVDWTLHLVGDGNQITQLKSECAKLGISDRVVFYGHLKNFKEILAESSIFVLPSFYEGFPNALLEAMMYRIACISTNCNAGPSDIIQNGKNGLLVKVNDVQDLLQAMHSLIEDQSLIDKLSTESFQDVKKYDLDTIGERYLNYISR